MEAVIVVAMTPAGGIGHQGTLPWHVPSELRHFHRLTTATLDPKKMNAVVMGRTTWNSLPIRPLPNRMNVILSSSAPLTSHPQTGSHVMFMNGLDTALTALAARSDIENTFVIGGAQVYNTALDHPRVTKARVSIVHTDSTCDVFFPLEKAQSCGWGDLIRPDDSVPETTDTYTGIKFTTFERRKSKYTINGEESDGAC